MFVVELLSVNDLCEHYSFFHSFMSKRLQVPLTAPLMDLMMLLTALKYISISVMWDTDRRVCLLRKKPGN